MRVMGLLGAVCILLLITDATVFAALVDSDGSDQFAVGSALLYYADKRVYHATTRCRQMNYHDCGNPRLGQPLDRVIADRMVNESAQLTLEYHPLGSKNATEPFLSANSVFASLVSGYGIRAENKRIFDGIGMGYTLSIFDAFGKKDAMSIGAGLAWLSDVHTLESTVRPGWVLRAHAPTEHNPMVTEMVTVSLKL